MHSAISVSVRLCIPLFIVIWEWGRLDGSNGNPAFKIILLIIIIITIIIIMRIPYQISRSCFNLKSFSQFSFM